MSQEKEEVETTKENVENETQQDNSDFAPIMKPYNPCSISKFALPMRRCKISKKIKNKLKLLFKDA